MNHRVVDLEMRHPNTEFEAELERKLDAAWTKLKEELGSGKRPRLVTLYPEYGTIYAIFDIEVRR